MTSAPQFSVIVPSLGRADGLARLLEALAAQTLPAERFETIVVLDGVPAAPELEAMLRARGVRFLRTEQRGGPGAARNRGARDARFEILAFTEDDCTPDREWLANAARRFEQEPGLDALDGQTEKPGGKTVRRKPGADPEYLPTNLFVRATTFQRIGGYCEQFFDPDGNVYFREDSDLGFSLERAGAKVVRDRTVRVTHPDEHPGWLDPLRWARRYRMDPLLARRHPEKFNERIEVLAWGPFRIRRPFVRACGIFIAGLPVLAAGLAFKTGTLTVWGALLSGAALLAIWSKWRFAPARLPLMPVVPFVLFAALAKGEARVKRLSL